MLRVAKDRQRDDELATFDFEGDSEFDSPPDDFGAGLDEGGSRPSGDGAAQGSSDEQEQDGGRRRKRRRRRKSKGTGGEVAPAKTQQRFQGRQGRPQYQGGGGGRHQGQNRNRPRRAKFQQNAPPAEAAVTSGTIEGVLELHPKGYGFIRDASNDFGARESDPFVSSSLVEKHQLREGIMIRGEVGAGARGQGPRLASIETIDGRSVEDYEQIKHFDTLTAINPFEQIKLETGPEPVTMRVMDLLTPIGKGQRALIVAPPRTGKTMLLQDIANSVSINHPEIHLIVLLIDERPEEVTEMRRKVRGEVIASSMDRDVESHVRISQLIIERGKRLDWYEGPTLMDMLETAHTRADAHAQPLRFPVQWVCRPQDPANPALHDYRGFMGRVESGRIAVGDPVSVLPSGLRTRVKAIQIGGDPLDRAIAEQSVALLLEDDIDVSRGDMIVAPEQPPRVLREITADLCWLSAQPMDRARTYLIRHTTREVRAKLVAIDHRLDVNTQERQPAERLAMNDIARVRFRLAHPVFADAYATNRSTGAFVVIDEGSNGTVGAGMIVDDDRAAAGV